MNELTWTFPCDFTFFGIEKQCKLIVDVSVSRAGSTITASSLTKIDQHNNFRIISSAESVTVTVVEKVCVTILHVVLSHYGVTLKQVKNINSRRSGLDISMYHKLLYRCKCVKKKYPTFREVEYRRQRDTVHIFHTLTEVRSQ